MGVFSDWAPILFENGLSIIPIKGKRAFLPEWSQYCSRHPTDAEMALWIKKYPDLNIGILGGTANGIRWLDVDSYTPEYCAKFLEMLPPVELRRIGAKGFAVPVVDRDQKITKFHYRGIEMGDFMGAGRQLVGLGVHPETKQPYQWLGSLDIAHLSLNELRSASIELSDADLSRIVSELDKFDFELHPKDIGKAAKKSGKSGAGGRNDYLKSICGAMYKRGCQIEQVAREILRADIEAHEKPLFSDKKEFSVPPEMAALKFATSVFSSFLNNKIANNEVVAQLESKSEKNVELSRRKSGAPHINADNVARLLSVMPKLSDALWYDEFYQRIRTKQGGVVREWQDSDDLNVLLHLQNKLNLPDMSLRAVQNGVEWYAHKNKKNEPRDWLDSLVWDGCKRIESFCVDALGARDSEYVRAVSRNWFVAMAARIYDPGCKFDNMIVLEGPQGKFKSSALEALAGSWFSASSDDIQSKDFLQSLSGKLIIEIAELDSFSRANIKTIKRVLSTRVDTYRPSYGRHALDFKRQCVFVGTTNEDEYLEDATGGRRFWPIKCGRIDIELILEHRDQLFSEAVAAFKNGFSWWEVPLDATLLEQEYRRRSDVWEEAIAAFLGNANWSNLTTQKIAKEALELDINALDKFSQMRIAAAMRSLGYSKKRTRTQCGRAYFWCKNVGEGEIDPQ